MPTRASSTVPNAAESSATQTRLPGTSPIKGKDVTFCDSVHNSGMNTTSVINESRKAEPRSSVIEAKRIVSSWTRCAAPSVVRIEGHQAM